MKKTKTVIIVVTAIILCMCVGGGIGFLGYKLYRHENTQANQISDLQGQVSYLSEKLKQTTDYYDFETEYKTDSFNYFAIGNSLTLITSWGRGICSTQPDNDYFNLVKKSLEDKYGEVVAYPYNYVEWERVDNRDQVYDLIDPYLSSELDLVTVQLGENVTNLTTYEDDLKSLINHIKEKAQSASILVIGDWSSIEKNEMRKNAAQNTDVLFADLSTIMGDKKYQSEAGTICYLNDGSTVEVSEAASTHPGDEGMKFIADQVIKTLELD